MSTATVPSAYAFFSVMRTRPSGRRCLARDCRSGEVALGVALAPRLGLVLKGPELAAPAKVPFDAPDQTLEHLAHIAGPEVPEPLPGEFAALLAPGAIGERVHLLRDDVGLGTDAAGEELSLLEDGCAQLAVALAGEELARRGLDAVPGSHLVGQDVLRATDRLDRHSAASAARYSSL